MRRRGFSRLGVGHSWRQHRRDEQAQVAAYQAAARRRRAWAWLRSQPERRHVLAALRCHTWSDFARSLREQLTERGSLSPRQTEALARMGRKVAGRVV